MVLQGVTERDVLERRIFEDGEEHLGRGVALEEADERGYAHLGHVFADDPDERGDMA